MRPGSLFFLNTVALKDALKCFGCSPRGRPWPLAVMMLRAEQRRHRLLSGGKAQPRCKFQTGSGTNRTTGEDAAARSLPTRPGEPAGPPPRTLAGLAAGGSAGRLRSAQRLRGGAQGRGSGAQPGRRGSSGPAKSPGAP